MKRGKGLKSEIEVSMKRIDREYAKLKSDSKRLSINLVNIKKQISLTPYPPSY